MEQKLINLIKTNHDAYYVSRGFYYQYLTVLHKWVNHYINGNDTVVSTEVGNDIKEVGEKLVYTQVKSYKAPFSLQSPILKKELFTFFVQYLEEKESNPELEFHFFTNTSLTKNETLLAAWIKAQPLIKSPLLIQCRKKIKEILKKELKALRKKKLEDKTKDEKEKLEIKLSFTTLLSTLENDDLMDNFMKSIQWFFAEETPAESIITLHNSVLEDLKHEKFEGHPPVIMLEALLSEICRCSQLEDSESRKVDNSLMVSIIAKKEDQIKSMVNNSLLKLLDVRFFSLKKKVEKIEETTVLHNNLLTKHSSQLNSLIEEYEKKQPVTFPKDLTLIPYVIPSDIIGREDELDILKENLKKNKLINLSGVGGIGKTTLASLYISVFRNEYDHLIWLDAETGIFDGFILNDNLMRNLSISTLGTTRSELNEIIQKLNNIQGNGLLIINDLVCEDKENISNLKSLYNWHIIITSRLRTDIGKLQQTHHLSFDNACLLYRTFEPTRNSDEDTFRAFFEFIEYNTLVIILAAKTIHLSFDLTLKTFLEYLQEQKLDDKEIEVDIEVGDLNVNLLSILEKTFSISSLNQDERYYMEFFALLPAGGITMQDIVLLYGKDYEKNNKIEFTKAINLLHKKGLITRTGNNIKMDMVFQESVLYQLRKDKGAFLSQMFHIPFLRARIQEGAQGDPAQAVRFAQYGQSVLRKIKEDFREPIYQPMLILENEVLNVQNWLQNPENLINKWEDLAVRASAKLNPEDFNLGTIFHNYALTLAGIGRKDEASEYFNKSITIFKSAKGSAHASHLLNMICNKAYLYLHLDDLKGFKDSFQELMDLRKIYDLWYDVTFPIQCHLLGTAYKNYGDFSEARKKFSMAVNAHQELPDESRNDLTLVIYLCDLAYCHLMDREIETAEKAAVWAVNIIHRLKIKEGKMFTAVVEILICISDFKGETENSAKLKKILIKAKNKNN
ncbi:tetratricopeptide repeat protein [Flavobacterium sp. N502540]|uniref:tetratricopeptide repeat protein n=1 Tax=Flavobacterium sp. N502540 TaxID=2986838 RepID=UPI002224C685|nr:tetratricopeptide repeat protein [Flavobacterium sp. N502540]